MLGSSSGIERTQTQNKKQMLASESVLVFTKLSRAASIYIDPRVVKTREINWCNKIIATFQEILQTFNCHIIGTTKNFLFLKTFFLSDLVTFYILISTKTSALTDPSPLKIVF